MNPSLTSTVVSEAASPAERRISIGLVALLTVASAASLIISPHATAESRSFIPAFAGSTGLADALAAALLFGLYRIERRRFVLFAACAYLLNAMLVPPYAALFPGIFPGAFAFGNEQSAAALWLTWHLAFAAILIAGAGLHGDDERRLTTRAAVACAVGTAAAGVFATLVVTAGHNALPLLVTHGRFSLLYTSLSALAAILNIVAVAAILRGRVTVLRLWLVVALSASALDCALNAFSPARYTFAWYVGKVDQGVSATAVLISLIVGWAAINARAIELAGRLGRSQAFGLMLQGDLEREYRVSSAFRDAALPRTLPGVDALELSATYRPADADAFVGGDWFDAFRLADDRIVLVVGDVMGTGLDAAITMNAVRQSIRGAAHAVGDAIAILDAADRALRLDDAEAMVTAFVAILNLREFTISYASAGHPPAFIRSASGAVRALEGAGLPLGLRLSLDAEQSAGRAALAVGDLVVLYTDGLTESSRDVIEGESRLRTALAGDEIYASHDPAAAIVSAIVERAFDDVAVLAARFAPEPQPEPTNGMAWRFPAHDAQHAAAARSAVDAELEHAGASADERFNAELVFSELVGNVLRHGGGDVHVVLDVGDGRVVLHVLDRGPGFYWSSRLPGSALSESGRGLFIVAALIEDFSITQRRGGGSHARAVLTPSGAQTVQAA